MFKFRKIESTISNEMLKRHLSSVSRKRLVCNAPFSALYFSHDGEVGACCLNKSSFYYGRYPQTGIKDIVKSNERKLQQKYVTKRNLSLGCQNCNEKFNSGQFTIAHANEYLNLTTRNKIRRIDFELFEKCSSNCELCNKGIQSNSCLFNDNFVDELYPYLLNITEAHFYGREPLRESIYFKIWKIILKRNPKCKIHIQTKGCINNQEISDLLYNHNIYLTQEIETINNIGVKVDNEVITKSYFENFYLFNEVFKQKKQIMNLLISPTAYNYKEIPEIIAFANHHDCLLKINNTRKSNVLTLDNRTAQEYDQILEIYINKLSQLPENSQIEKQNKKTLSEFIKLLCDFKENSLSSDKVIISSDYIIEIVNNRVTQANKEHYEIVHFVLNKIKYTWKISSRKIEVLNTDYFWSLYENLFLENKTKEEITLMIEDYLELENEKIPLA